MKKILLSFLAALLTVAAQAGKITVNMETPGTLNLQLNGVGIGDIYDLKISGPINGNDIYMLRNDDYLRKALIFLDLSEAQIVDGGIYAKIKFTNVDTLTTYTATANCIGKLMFANMPYLKELILPESIEKIENSAISYCDSLQEIVIPDNVREVGSYAFCNDKNLIHATIGYYVEYIRPGAFRDSNLAEVNCRATTPPYIYSDTFNSNTYSNARLVVPAGTKSAYANHNYWGQFTNIVEGEAQDFRDEEVSIINMTEAGTLDEVLAEKDLDIIKKMKIAGNINNDDFAVLRSMMDEYKSLLELDLSEAVIVDGGSYAFKGETVEGKANTITDGAFSLCFNDNSTYGNYLKKVVLPGTVTNIGKWAFHYCLQLADINIDSLSSLESIGEYAFYSCRALTGVNIPNSVKAIGGQAFDGCSALETVTIGKSVEIIGSLTFGNCPSLKAVTFPDDCKLDTIGYAAFSGSGLKEISLPASLKCIYNNAFGECGQLEELTIGKSDALEICQYAFKDCPLKRITCQPDVPPVLFGGGNPGCVYSTSNPYAAPFSEETFMSCEVVVPEGAEDAYMKSPCWMVDEPYRALWRAFFAREVDIPASGFIAFGAPYNVKVPDGVTVYKATGMGDYVLLTKLNTNVIPSCNFNVSSTTDSYGGLTTAVILYKENGGKVSLNFTESQPSSAILDELKFNANGYECNMCYYGGEAGHLQSYWYQFNPNTTQFELITTPLDTYDTYVYSKSSSDILPVKYAAGSELPTGIVETASSVSEPCGYYTVDGKRVDAPRKGISIVRYSDGTTRKVIVK